MWHEARKQERLLKSMMVDHRKRAERRRDYYEKTKGDPAQFLQIHGRQAKIHIDPAIAAAADSPATMMQWQGQSGILIDRFDVRAHLDFIPERPKKDEDSDSSQGSGEEVWEERQASYERYRILVQNEFIGVSEEKFLHQIHVEEQFGPVHKVGEEDKKKVLAPKKAAIGFTYDDSTPSSSSGMGAPPPLPPVVPTEAMQEDDSDSDIDLDLSIAVDKLTTEQMHEVNKCAMRYGLGRQDFMSLLTKDLDEQESMRVAKEEEQERAMYSGRRARKERRAFREQKLQALLMNRCLSPPSYATRDSPTYTQYRRSASGSKSRSPSPFDGNIKFITSFGDEEDSDTGGKGKMPHARSFGKPHEKEGSSRKPSMGTSVAREKAIRTNAAPTRNMPVKTRERRSRSNSRRSKSPRQKQRSSRRRSRSVSRSRSRSRSRSGRGSRSRKSRERSRRRSHSRNRSYRPRTSRSISPRGSRYKRSRRSTSSSSSSSSPSTSSSSSSSSPSSSSSSPSSRGTSPSKPGLESLPLKNREARQSTPPPPPPPPAPPIRRYYGRQKSDSNSDSSLSHDESPTTQSKPSGSSSKPSHQTVLGSSAKSAGATKSTLTPQEKLKRKMQMQLSKQYKVDKMKEKEKLEKLEQEKQTREEEMRQLSLHLRRRERIRRHAAGGGPSYPESGSSSGPSSRSHSPSS